ncbi:hypothetical protein [Jeongeupia naejangsanensis]|uniref:DUF1850 domain-containing protein n=1 Tax=Jeongeupia naejangsanensis TaxID=613195 RepID=A0ABS2BMF8_9NEIS|nr:hypothetical protein [Jeongeupia naejangsanensis]MBM3116804.1 hypothetical protein [Jeongeupia naejangsanensis]
MKRIHLALWLLPLAALLTVGFVIVNSLGCNYELRINHRNLSYYGVCRFGDVTFLESDQQTGSQWSVSAYQISIANQLIFLVRERRQLRDGAGSVQLLDDYNHTQNQYLLVNYAWMPVDDGRIALFQTSPHHDVWLGKRDGPIDLMDALFPRQPPDWRTKAAQ